MVVRRTSDDAPRPGAGRLRQSLAAGWIAALAAGTVAALVVSIATGEGYGVFLIAGPLAGLIAGASIWYWLVIRRGRFGLVRGGLAGVSIVIAGHWLTWLLVMLGSGLCNALTGGCVDSLGQSPIGPLDALWGAFFMGLLSVVFTGVISLPVGILAGCLLARAQRPRISGDAA